MTHPDDTPLPARAMPDGSTHDGTVACLEAIFAKARAEYGDKGIINTARTVCRFGWNYTPAARQHARETYERMTGKPAPAESPVSLRKRAS